MAAPRRRHLINRAGPSQRDVREGRHVRDPERHVDGDAARGRGGRLGLGERAMHDERLRARPPRGLLRGPDFSGAPVKFWPHGRINADRAVGAAGCHSRLRRWDSRRHGGPALLDRALWSFGSEEPPNRGQGSAAHRYLKASAPPPMKVGRAPHPSVTTIGATVAPPCGTMRSMVKDTSVVFEGGT